MEISARVLREVEFNSSLRGYNTDEVDEFLEQVADAVDRLHEEARSAAERAEAAERAPREPTGLDDDDSIKRTLVLAQRTADLAIREAQEEAAQLLDRARGEADVLVTDARDSAERISSEAERRLRDEVSRLGAARDDLRKEVDTLVSLLAAERERLTETLGAALRYVERSLTPSPDLLSLPAAGGGSAGGPASGGDAAEAPGTDGPSESDASGGSGTPDKPAAAGPPAEGAAEAPATSETPAVSPGDAKAGEGDSAPPEVDDLEAAIAEDAAAAGPAQAQHPESDDYDWDSVIRGAAEPMRSDRGHGERPSLTALPSIGQPSKGTAAMKSRGGRPSDWPA